MGGDEGFAARADLTTLRSIADQARGRTLAQRALRAIRRGRASAPVTPTDEQRDQAAQVAADHARMGRKRAPNSADVFRWWVAAARSRFGEAYVAGAWTRAQQAKAKQLLASYGPTLVQEVVDAAWAQCPTTHPPTLDAVHAARERVFAAWQLERVIPPLFAGEGKGDRSRQRRDRLKNFDEYDGPVISTADPTRKVW